jgi:hypothetical protein
VARAPTSGARPATMANSRSMSIPAMAAE